MWAWPKKNPEPQVARSLARAVLAGAARQEILREVLLAAGSSRADRLGVWLLQDSFPGTAGNAELRGLVREGGEEQMPAEWEKLSLESPIPYELLSRGNSVEQALDPAAGRPMFGLLIGLHHVLWTPVRGRDRLRGLLFSGWQTRPAGVPREFMESLAAELALAVEFEEQQRLSREREIDLRFSQEILSALYSGTSTDTVLSRLVASCAELCSAPSAAGFAVLGHFPVAASGSEAAEVEFDWESGNTTWTHGIDREPLASVWRQALESGQSTGADPPASWAPSGLARLLAIPVCEGERRIGLLLCGIASACSSLYTLERVKLRASLARAALERRGVNAERLRRAARRQAFLDSNAQATLLIDFRGVVAAANRAARMLIEEEHSERSTSAGLAVQPVAAPPAWYINSSLAQLFCARAQPRIDGWLARALPGGPGSASDPVLPCEAELLTGTRVRLRPPLAVGDDLVALVVEPADAAREYTAQEGRSQAELHHVLEWVEEGVLLFAVDQAIRGMNTRFAQIAGLSAEDASSCSSLEDLLQKLAPRAAEPEAFAARWRELARGSEAGTREEVQLARPVPRILERAVRPVLDSAGRRLGRVEVYRDLTAQRVFQAKLLQTEKLAALGQMITGVAHELSNPLTSILGYAQRLLVRNELVGRTTEAHQIYQEAERASAILRQLLLTAREARPERKPVALNQVVQRAMELQRFGSAAEKIRIELDLDPALPFVMGDAGQLQQVLMNLIGNGRQAISQEGRPGTIRLRTTRAGQHRVRLQVIDDGPGVPDGILARIFDPFFTTKPAGVGTGLGLSIVLSVVREHGGQVHVSNSPSGGAIFSVELPVVAEAAVDAAGHPDTSLKSPLPLLPAVIGQKSRLPVTGLAAPRVSHRGTRVLVVEDEPTVARLIADVLEDEGMRVDVLLDGREALDRAMHETYDLVVCDMKMPGIDGQNFYRSLAQTRTPLHHHFLFVTGDVLAPQTQEFLERNRIPYVAKPFRVEELSERIHRLLDGPWSRAESAAAGQPI